MTRRDDTKLLGLRGLYIEAQRRDDAQAARLVAEEAAKAAPSLAWAGQAVLDYRCAAADWAGALDALDAHEGRAGEGRLPPQARRAADRPRAGAGRDRPRRRARGGAGSGQARARSGAGGGAGRAAAGGSGRAAQGAQNPGERRGRSIRIPISPRPMRNLRLGDSARERLARMQKLADKVPGQLEGALAVARAALDAREFAGARAALAPYLSAPTRRVATLMAEIEESRARRRRPRARMDGPRHARVRRSGVDRRRRGVRALDAGLAATAGSTASHGKCRWPRSASAVR